MAIGDFYNKTMDIYTQGHTVNQMGEHVETKTLLASSVPCRINRLTGRNQIYLDNIDTYISLRVYCDPRSDYEEWDYLLIDNKYYKVFSSPIIFDDDEEHHMQVDCFVEDRK